MTRSEEARRVESELSAVFPEPDHVEVTDDPYSGLRILVVSDRFIGMGHGSRRGLVLGLVDDDRVAHLRLLTRAEHQAGDDVQSTEPDDVPLWPEALVRGQAENIVVHLPTRTFTPLTAPVVATFYSLRGGVGRSTALAHTARMLAAQGLTVLCVDMDLEAPGLAALFGVEEQAVDGKGVVPLLLGAEIADSIADLDEHIIRVTEDLGLYLLPAGLPNANYARQLALLDPSAWYREDVNPLRLLMHAIRELEIPSCPDVVLIDSRTGISPLAAPLLFDIADVNIVTFFPHPQARIGTRALTRSLLAARSMRSTPEEPISPELRFVVSPVPATPEVRLLYADRSQEWVREWLSPARDSQGDVVFEDLEEIIQVVGYSELIAASDSVLDVDTVSDFNTVAEWIAGLIESRDAGLSTESVEPHEPSKDQVLASLTFAGETAEHQDRAELMTTFLSTSHVEKAMRPDVPVVIGRKGTGKTAIFRKLAAESGAVVVTSPPGTDTHRSSTPDADVYAALGDELARRGMGWRQVWPLIIGITMLRELDDVAVPDWLTQIIGSRIHADDYRKSDVLRDLRSLLDSPDSTLRMTELLIAIDRAETRDRLLLFDALDTGFGNTDIDRDRRSDGVAGLLTTVSSLGPQFARIKFKVMIREDIWREAALPNKSHLEARAARLNWSDQTDYLRIAIKQAWRSELFRALVSERLDKPDFRLGRHPIDYWPREFVRDAWVILAGERVAGGRTAYTDNWVWSRLADANGDHSPRALAQLLTAATEREREFERGNPYTRSIIRPRALVESLDEVSEQALDALRNDEFPELDPVFRELSGIGSTPFDANLLRSAQNLIRLAREVGLLEPVTSRGDSADRYRVPELYRKALNMSRKGQA